MTLYLSRLTLDRRAPSRALAPLLDPEDRHRAADAHHRLIWTAFSDGEDREDANDIGGDENGYDDFDPANDDTSFGIAAE